MCQINTAVMKKQIGCLDVHGKIQSSYIIAYVYHILLSRTIIEINCLSNFYLPIVSPDILTGETSSDTTVKEGSDVLLTCKATGTPKPKIMWRRENGKSFVIKDGKKGRKGRYFK